MGDLAEDVGNSPGDLPEPDAGPIFLNLVVQDPETAAVLHEYEEGRQRADFALTALKVGVLAIRAARGTVDAVAVHREAERLLELLAEKLDKHRERVDSEVSAVLASYFDPQSGKFNERVTRLVSEDGELAGLIHRKVEDASKPLGELLSQHLGEDSPLLTLLSPTDGNALLAAMKATVDNTVKAQSEAVLLQFSLDNPKGALRRLIDELKEEHGDLEKALAQQVQSVVQEFSLDREDSALSRLVKQVDKAQSRISSEFSLDNASSGLSRLSRLIQDAAKDQRDQAQGLQDKVLELLTRIDTRRQEQERSTTHGLVFEEAVGEALKGIMASSGDVVTNVGTTAGLIPRNKVGDFTVTLSDDCAAPGAVIVVEAKEDASYGLSDMLSEAQEACRNRGAGICLFVVSKARSPADLPTFERHGQTVVVVWDAKDPATDIVLKAGLSCAKALSVRAARRSATETASVQILDKAIGAIRKQMEGFDEIRASATTVESAGKKIGSRAQIMQEQIIRQLDAFDQEFVKFKEGAPPQ